MSAALRWGLIGGSDIAATRMIPAMRASGHAVVGIMSGDSERAARYAERNQLEFSTSEIGALLDRSDID
ncbi:MAG TPA: Gfo/Idh/MocA family oxidoreductase, partial [Candidatus Tumulicola sp.]|nr:Gfo/Idh/MocA family oxidoreductase [Candidatus Tumulicola sp.]